MEVACVVRPTGEVDARDREAGSPKSSPPPAKKKIYAAGGARTVASLLALLGHLLKNPSGEGRRAVAVATRERAVVHRLDHRLLAPRLGELRRHGGGHRDEEGDQELEH